MASVVIRCRHRTHVATVRRLTAPRQPPRRMKDLLLTLLHLVVMTARLCGPGGVRAVIAEHFLLSVSNSL